MVDTDNPDAIVEPHFWSALRTFWRPIAFFGLFSVAILTTDHFITQNEQAVLRRYASEDLATVAHLNSDAISIWASERIGDSIALTKQLALTRDLEAWLADSSPSDDRAARILARMETLNVYRNYRRISLIGPNGETLLSTDPQKVATSPETRALECEARRTGKPQLSTLPPSAETPGFSDVVICTPVVSTGVAHKIIATVRLEVDPNLSLLPLMTQWPGRSSSAEVNILMRRGNVVQFLARPRHAPGTPSQQRAALFELPITSENSPAAAAVRGFHGTMEGVDYHGALVLAATTNIPNTPWFLVAKIDKDDIYAPFRRLRTIGFVGAGLLILIAGMTLFAILRREQATLLVRKLQAELHEREIAQRFDYLSRNTDEIVLLVDQGGHIVEANERAVSAYGYPAAQLIGRSVTDLHPANANLDFLEPQTNKHAKNAPSAIFQSVQRRRNGSLFSAEISARWIDHDKSRRLQLIIRDTTERRERVAALTQLGAIIESSNGAIIGADLDGTVRTWNPAAEKLLGYTADEIIGQSANVFLPPDRPGEIARLIGKVRAGEIVNGYETVRQRKDGSLVNVSLIYSPIHDTEGTLTGISAIVIDISGRVKATQRAEYASRALRTLSRANEALIRATSEQELFDQMCKVITEVGGYRLAWIGHPENDAEKSVRVVAWAGLNNGYLEANGVCWSDTERGRGPTGAAIRTGRTQINQNFTRNPTLALWREAALERGFNSSIALPLKLTPDSVYGSLTIYAPEPDAFVSEEVSLLEELANDLAFGISTIKDRQAREELAANMAEAMEGTIAAVANTVEMRDLYTAGHQRRVTEIAEAIATKLGLPEDRIKGLRLAGIVHDLGKINVPAEILNKPAKLSDVEYELIKTHPQTGYDILKHVKFPWPIAQIILQHHERMDGSGYPAGLRGDQILLEARIIAVADVVDSMTSHRPYRPALGLEAALDEIKQGSGTLYDPDVVEACVQVMRANADRFTSPHS